MVNNSTNIYNLIQVLQKAQQNIKLNNNSIQLNTILL
jgi:hypothetical protein